MRHVHLWCFEATLNSSEQPGANKSGCVSWGVRVCVTWVIAPKSSTVAVYSKKLQMFHFSAVREMGMQRDAPRPR